MDAARVSADLFGRPSRLPLALWILEHDKRFYQSEPPHRDFGGQTAVSQELARFVRAGLLDEVRPDGDNRVYYDMTHSPLWDIIRKAGDVVRAE